MRNDLQSGNCSPATTRGSEWALPTVGDLFQSFFAPAFPGATAGPALDVTEDGDVYRVTADVPGYTMDQINVQFEDSTLTLTGERAEKVEAGGPETDEKNGDGRRWHIVERARGSFSRSIKFPMHVDATGIKAALKNGVLDVTIPKAAAAKAQKIKITEN